MSRSGSVGRTLDAVSTPCEAARRHDSQPQRQRRRALRLIARRPSLGRGWPRLISPLVLLLIWEFVSTAGFVSAQKLPPPSTVWSTGLHLIETNSPAYGTLQHAMLVSLERFVAGFALGGTAAPLLAITAGLSQVGELTIDPLVQMIRTLPLFGLIPVFIVWFGIGSCRKYC